MHADHKAIFLLVAIQALSMGALEMSGPFWPLHIKALLGPASQEHFAFFTMGVYAGPLVAAMLLSPLWARYGDRVGHKAMILRALLALSIFQGAVAFISDPTTLVITRSIQGGLAGFLVAAQAYALCCCHEFNKAKTLALLQSATAIGSLVGPVVGGWLIDKYDFKHICSVAAYVCLACAIGGAFLTNHRPQAYRYRQRGPVIRLDRKWLAGLLSVMFFLQAAKVISQPFYSLYVLEVLNAPGWLIGITYAASAATLAVSAPLWGKLFDHHSHSQTLRLIEGIAWLCALTMAITIFAQGWLSFLITRLVWGVWQGALLPVTYAIIAQTIDSTQRGFVMALGNSAAKAGSLLGIALGASTLAWMPLAQSFWIVAATYVAAAIAIRLMRKRTGAPRSIS